MMRLRNFLGAVLAATCFGSPTIVEAGPTNPIIPFTSNPSVMDHVFREGEPILQTLMNTEANLTASSLTSSGVTATITFTGNHGVPVGQAEPMRVYGATPTAYNGTFTFTATTTTSGTYTCLSSCGATASGTITAKMGADLSSVTNTGGGSFLGTLYSPLPNYAVYIDHLSFSCNKNIVLNVTLQGGSNIPGAGITPSGNIQLVLSPGVPAVVPLHIFLRPATYGSAGIGVTQRDVLDVDRTNVVCFGQVIGYEIADDFNFNASSVILWEGDSLSKSTAGVTDKTGSQPFLTLKYFKDKGCNCRLVLRATSGSTAVGHDNWRYNGGEDILDTVSLIVIELGTNDEGVNSATVVGQTVTNWIAWKQAHHPLAKMLILGPPQRNNGSEESALALIRTAEAAAVTAAADNNVKYCSLASPQPFDNTNSANYADSTSPYVHPNQVSNVQIWTTNLKPCLDANVPTL